MPTSPRETVLCLYDYDPLDRQARCTPFEQMGIQRFYCKSRLSTEIQDTMQHSIFQHNDQLLAQQQSQSGKLDTTLLATDQQRSVLNALDATRPNPIAYTPYGHWPQENGLLTLLGFNGERPDPVTRHYHLGNGYRQFNPVLMRFNSPDSWSPFREGGLNAYAYCVGDPVNRRDPTGHFPWSILQMISGGALVIGVVGGIASTFIEDRNVAEPLKIISGFLVTAGIFGAVTSRIGMGMHINQRRVNAPPLAPLSRSNSSASLSAPPPNSQTAIEMRNLRASSPPNTPSANRLSNSQGNLGNTRRPQDNAQRGASALRPQSNVNANVNAGFRSNLNQIRQK